MQFNRIMNVKPGSLDKVMKMAQKFPERAKMESSSMGDVTWAEVYSVD